MPHFHRFYIAPGAASQSEAELTGAEAHHALHAVRIREGDEVGLFDGQGGVWRGRITRRERRSVRVELLTAAQAERPAVRLTLLQAMLRRDKALEELARRVTELGVARVVLYEAERSERPARASEKLRNASIESAKQCGQAWLPVFERADSFAAALDRAEGEVLLATADRPPAALADALRSGAPALAIGPEGDFAGEELELAEARGAVPISLGATTFRAEQAAALGAALVLYECGRLGLLPEGRGTKE